METNHKEIFEEINLLRSDPPKYAEKILKYTTYFKDKILRIPGCKVGFRTQEGEKAYKEAAAFLKTQPKLEPFIPSKALHKIAVAICEKAKDSETGDVDDVYVEEQIDANGTFEGKFTRAMDFGAYSAEQVVINCMVCDGDETRFQRDPLLGDGLKKVGVAYGPHSLYTTVAVICSTNDFITSGDDTENWDDVTPIDHSKNAEAEEEARKKAEEEARKKAEEEEARRKAEEEEARRKAEEEEKRKQQEKEEAERKAAESQQLSDEQKKKEEEEEAKRKAEKEAAEKEAAEKAAAEKAAAEKAAAEKAERDRKEAEERAKKAKKPFNPKAKPKVQSNPRPIFRFGGERFLSLVKNDDEKLPPGVKSRTKSERITFENGKRVRYTTFDMEMEDGSKKTEEKREELD